MNTINELLASEITSAICYYKAVVSYHVTYTGNFCPSCAFLPLL